MEVLIQIEDKNFDKFETYLKKFNAKILDFYPEELFVNSKYEVKKRVFEAEKRIQNGEFMDEEQFETFVKKLIDENN
jgi:glycerol-3-phosphate O-acyltransferase